MVEIEEGVSAGSTPAKSAPVNPYAYVVVAVLGVTYMLNFLDRQLLSVLAEPVKQDLGLSDTQLGALTGFTFALFYSVFGIPVAWLADRTNRVRVVAISCALWSAFTAASGAATNFATLAAARIGVGVGEAGCSPPSYSIIADYFPSDQRGKALALYLLGVPFGSLIGAATAGWIAAEYGWRMAFISLGVIGLVFAPAVILLVREPPRGRFDDKSTKSSVSRNPLQALRHFFTTPALVLSALGAGMCAFVSYGILNWAPAYLTRVKGMSLHEIAAYYSVCVAGSMMIAAWLGALFSDKLGAKRPMLYALAPGVGLLLTIPFLFGFTAASDWPHALPFLIPPLVLSTTYLVPALAYLQNRTPPDSRATASSILLFLLNLIGLGCGPLFVGIVSDRLQPVYGENALGHALNWLTPFIVVGFLAQLGAAWLIERDERKAALA